MIGRLALAVLLAVPATAQAATVGVAETDGPGLAPRTAVVVDAAPGEANRVTLTFADGGVTVTDAGAPLTAVAPCVALDASTVRCEDDATVARVRLGDGDDTLETATPEEVGEVRADGGPGEDRLRGGKARDVFFDRDGAEPDVYHGDDGYDVLTYARRADNVVEEDRLTEVEEQRGGRGDDVLTGSRFRDVLFGGPGDDTLQGRGGVDTVRGGTGDDRLVAFTGLDELSCQRGRDAVLTIRAASVLGPDCERVDLAERVGFVPTPVRLTRDRVVFRARCACRGPVTLQEATDRRRTLGRGRVGSRRVTIFLTDAGRRAVGRGVLAAVRFGGRGWTTELRR